MQVLAFPTNSSCETQEGSDWRTEFFGFLNSLLDKIENGVRMKKLWDMTRTIAENKSELLGHLTLGFVKKAHPDLMDQEYCDCPKCKKKLKSRGKHKRMVATHLGEFELFRPYFYCIDCKLGFYPLDAALGLSASPKQYDVDDLGNLAGQRIAV